MCEWCGNEHDKSVLCTSRPKWSRRGFLALFGTGIAGAVVAVKVPFVQTGNGYTVGSIADAVGDGTIGGITRSTFSFWRNQAPLATASLNNLMSSMGDLMNAEFTLQPDYLTVDAETLKRYQELLA